MTKPVGPICNLGCSYCFYLDKKELYPQTRNWRMNDEVLDAYVRQYIQQQDVPEISFAWQGGEPTLLGIDFFRKVVALQQKYADGKRITNALQTNGTLLNDAWCSFLAEHHFLIGVSIDGPRELHDRYRVGRRNEPTFDLVLRGLNLLKTHRVEFNTLTVVNRVNSKHPLEVYSFLKEAGSNFIQFIPLVERRRQAAANRLPPGLAKPPNLAAPLQEADSPVTEWSVQARQYGDFLVHIFDAWVRRDVGQVFVQLFDVALGQWMGLGSSLCVFAERCGQALAVEHNGDLYSCDHYVYPQHLLGNILTHTLYEAVTSNQQEKFGADKSRALPAVCRRCEFLPACNGECPKHRFCKSSDGEPGLNYLCPAYKRFFGHVAPYMKRMAQLFREGRAASDITAEITRDEAREQWANANRNDPCPCGSGRKFKKCCA